MISKDAESALHHSPDFILIKARRAVTAVTIQIKAEYLPAMPYKKGKVAKVGKERIVARCMDEEQCMLLGIGGAKVKVATILLALSFEIATFYGDFLLF